MKPGTIHPRCSRHGGFTLVELMVVMAIVAILASFAYSGYRSQVVKTHRSAAKACLTQYASFMERYYTTNNLTYVGAVPSLDCAIQGNMAQNYTFGVSGLSATAFTVTATRTAAFAGRDTTCGNLSLDNRGARTVSSGTVADCW
jgi:type IV pilus assembly protein PilE